MKFFIWLINALKKGNENQRKQLATMLNTLAAVILVQLTFQGRGFTALFGLITAFGMWYIAYQILSEDKL
ncbi:hypothetical protein [uncultured Cardiobacterium sp.]|uniref:hypothetical protein n=1 Tax=uncultured Cardiobacterium sp. TaxID=417619 RepID=UPI0026064809|nr:hypothetical protein [uncultured Cardiobacterium sp.]